jgi:hypothetical protein
VRTDLGREIISRMIDQGVIESKPGDSDPGAIALMRKLAEKSRARWPSRSGDLGVLLGHRGLLVAAEHEVLLVVLAVAGGLGPLAAGGQGEQRREGDAEEDRTGGPGAHGGTPGMATGTRPP